MTHHTQKARLQVAEITTRPEDFQFRAEELDPYHAGELLKAIEQGSDVGPLDVWLDPDSGSYVVLDGHHRLAAHKQAGTQARIPVIIHHGTINEVRLVALEDNAKARLPMSQAERLDAAWRLVQVTNDDGGYVYTKPAIAGAAGVGTRTVPTMRKVMKQLLEAGEDLPERWAVALMVSKAGWREPLTEGEAEALIEAKAAELDAKVGKQIAEYSKRYPEAVSMMLQRRMGQKFDFMVEYYRDDLDDLEDSPF